MCRTFVASLFAICLIAGAAWAQEKRDMALELRFDEETGALARDTSGNGNDARVHGAQRVKLKKGYALKFDGQHDYVDCGKLENLDFSKTDFTIEAWVRPATITGGDHTIVSKGTWWGPLWLRQYEDDLILAWGTASSNRDGLVRKDIFNPDTWYHIVATRSGDAFKIYSNGTVVGSKSSSVKIGSAASYGLAIGRGSQQRVFYFHGVIKEVRFHNRALTAEEIKGNFERVAQSDLELQVKPRKPPTPAKPTLPIANLVTNPSFEKPDPADPNRPEGFNSGRVPTWPRKAKMTWETGGHGGKRCVAVETLDSNDLGYWETVVPVKPRTEYALSFYYKCRSATAVKTEVGEAVYNKGRPGGPNLELGVVPDDGSTLAKPNFWTDIGWAMDPVGGAYLPLVSEWSLHRRMVRTLGEQTKLRIKLRLFCYAQKVWFDDLSVVELASVPEFAIVAPTADSVVRNGTPTFQWNGPEAITTYSLEYSTSPMFSHDTTKCLQVRGSRFSLKERLPKGFWFWHVGVPDRYGVPFWFAESSFHVSEKAWAEKDTTPPTVSVPKPVPNANGKADATISVRVSDTGSGIDVSSAKVLLDGKDVSAHAKVLAVGERGVILLAPRPLLKGPHRVTISVADKAGNLSNTLSWQFGVGQALSNAVRIEGQKVWLNDQPYFGIGINCYACHPGDGRFSESQLAQATAAGFDCLLNTYPPGPDMLHKHGMMSLMNISANIKKCDTLEHARTALLEEGQARFRDHPCVLGYYGDDPENVEDTKGTPISKTALEKLDNTRKVLKEEKPDHPLVWAMSNLSRFKDGVPTADILVPYRYAVPHYHPQMIYGWMLHYVYTVSGDKPVWFNSQAVDLGYGAPLRCGHQYRAPFKPTDIIRPTPAEMRAMAYYALVCGVRGYTMYANYLTPKSHPTHWPAALKIVTEMRHLGPVLAAGEDVRAVTMKQDSTWGSIYLREIEHKGAHTLIAVNMSAGRVAVTWQFRESTGAIVLFEDRAMSEKSGTVSDLFKPWEVHIYRW